MRGGHHNFGGYHLKPETIERIRQAKLGEKNPFFGKKHNMESRLKMSIKLKGKPFTEEHKKKIGLANIGRKYSEQTLEKMSKSKLGSKNGMFGQHQSALQKNKASEAHWLGGVSKTYTSDYEFKLNRRKILERDNFTCRNCLSKEKLAIDHIVPYRVCQNHSEENLQVLCKRCNSSKMHSDRYSFPKDSKLVLRKVDLSVHPELIKKKFYFNRWVK